MTMKKSPSRHKPPTRKKSYKPSQKDKQVTSDELYPMRLNKYIAHSGKCSRRKAADWVKAGLVTLNGVTEKNPAVLVQEEDVVTVKGERVKPESSKVYLLLNKPKGIITTVSDERERRTVMSLIKGVKERIYPVGRLDRNTTGLLLLTNDGELAQKLSHPSGKVKKVYHVVLNDALREQDLEKISKGLELEDGVAQVDSISWIEGKPKWEVGIELHIGKNRIVRRIFESLGYEVVRLDRTYYAGLTKKNLGRGRYRRLSDKEIRMLRHFT